MSRPIIFLRLLNILKVTWLNQIHSYVSADAQTKESRSLNRDLALCLSVKPQWMVCQMPSEWQLLGSSVCPHTPTRPFFHPLETEISKKISPR